MVRFVSFAYAGCLPEEMGIGPVYAIPKALKLAGLTLEEIDLIELNEAFAAQSLAVMKTLHSIRHASTSMEGRLRLAIPWAARAPSSCQLIREMKRRDARYGLVTMCVGGGQGAAGIFENLQT